MKFLNFLNKHKGKIILILIIAGAGYYYFTHHKKPQVREEISTDILTRGNIMSVLKKDGALTPKHSTEVNSPADGRILKMFVQEGDTVKKGQKLLTVTPGKNIYEKYVPIDIYASMAGMVVRCMNDRISSRSKTSYSLPAEDEAIQGSSNYSNPTCIMKIINPDIYVLPIKIGEYDIDKIYVGMPIKIKVSAKPDLDIDGKISLISPQPEVKEESRWDPDSNKVEFIVVAETENYKGPLILGLTATVVIDLAKKEDVLTVPLSAVYEERDRYTQDIKYFIYKQIGDKKAKKIEVKLGLKNDTHAEILEPEKLGLQEKDTLFLDIKGDKIEVEDDGLSPKKDGLNKEELKKKFAGKRGGSVGGTVKKK